MLVGFRLVQAALLTPTSLGLVLASYEPERRTGAVRAWTATSGGDRSAFDILPRLKSGDFSYYADGSSR